MYTERATELVQEFDESGNQFYKHNKSKIILTIHICFFI